MEENKARLFAELNFKKLPEHYYKWNVLHAKYMIKALEELSKNDDIDTEKLKALAWVHDIGKIESDENHAEISIKILEKEFELDEIDRDCILNHGSTGKPQSKEARIFQNADGLSLFYPEMLLFWIWMDGKGGNDFDKFKEKIKKQYEKYLIVYSENPTAIRLLKEKFSLTFNN